MEFSSFTVGSGSNERKVATLEVKSKAWDEHLGGFQFDLRLAELLADRFNAKWTKGAGKGKDVRSFPKAMAKLRAQAKKVGRSHSPARCLVTLVWHECLGYRERSIRVFSVC